MIVLGFAHWHGTPLQPFLPPGQSLGSSLNLGLAVGVWMYSGYDSMSTIAGEVHNPRRLIPRGLMIAMPIIVALYVLPTLAGLAGVGRWSEWATTGGISFVEMTKALGGPVLGDVMLGVAVISNMALYQDYRLRARGPPTRWPGTTCCPGPSPGRTAGRHTGGLDPVPGRAQPGAHHRLVRQPGGDRRLSQHVYYLLIFAAVIRLRQKEPDLERPFRIRGGTGMLVAICVPAIVIALVTLYSNAIDTSTTILGHASFTRSASPSAGTASAA